MAAGNKCGITDYKWSSFRLIDGGSCPILIENVLRKTIWGSVERLNGGNVI